MVTNERVGCRAVCNIRCWRLLDAVGDEITKEDDVRGYAIVDKDGVIQKATVGMFTQTYEFCISPTQEEAQLILDEAELFDCKVVPVEIEVI